MRRLVLAPKWLQFLIVILLIFGIFFRFVNLDRKIYSHNETHTLLRISGYTATQVKQQIFNGRIISKQAFVKFQRLNPEKNIGDTIKSLATDNPQHPPFYYVIVRFWVQIFGDSVTAIRSLSAVISLFVFPCVYWLCKELFKVPLSLPGIAVALIAVSPMQIIYAQEAQEYILWEVTILLCSAALLRALRLESISLKEDDRIINWGTYTLTLALSLYTSLLSGFVALAHIIYVFTIYKLLWKKTIQLFLNSLLVGFLIFIPWILAVLANQLIFKEYTDSLATSLSVTNLFTSWLLQTSRIFADLNFTLTDTLNLILLTPIIFSLFGYAIYFLWRTTHVKSWSFITTLILVPLLPLMLSSWIIGKIKLASQLDLMPYYLSVSIAVAYLLATQLYNGCISHQKFWQTILVIIIMTGLFSNTLYSQSNTWWSKFNSSAYPEIAKIINQTSRSLLISNTFSKNYENIFSLSYLIEPEVKFLFIQNNNLPKLPKNVNNIFILNPSYSLRKFIEKKYKYTNNIVYKDEYFLLLKLSK